MAGPRGSVGPPPQTTGLTRRRRPPPPLLTTPLLPLPTVAAAGGPPPPTTLADTAAAATPSRVGAVNGSTLAAAPAGGPGRPAGVDGPSGRRPLVAPAAPAAAAGWRPQLLQQQAAVAAARVRRRLRATPTPPPGSRRAQPGCGVPTRREDKGVGGQGGGGGWEGAARPLPLVATARRHRGVVRPPLRTATESATAGPRQRAQMWRLRRRKGLLRTVARGSDGRGGRRRKGSKADRARYVCTVNRSAPWTWGKAESALQTAPNEERKDRHAWKVAKSQRSVLALSPRSTEPGPPPPKRTRPLQRDVVHCLRLGQHPTQQYPLQPPEAKEGRRKAHLKDVGGDHPRVKRQKIMKAGRTLPGKAKRKNWVCRKLRGSHRPEVKMPTEHRKQATHGRYSKEEEQPPCHPRVAELHV